jgi:acetylornithine deacetylase/succinyl-diaminopimelate desuccinylase-like protein
MYRLAALALAVASSAVAATNPVARPSKLDPAWQAKTRDLFRQVIEIPTVHHRGEVPKMATVLAGRLKAAGWAPSDIEIRQYEGLPGDKTAALIARWRADKPAKKPLMIIGHMDVVEAKREEWQRDPFKLVEEGGYFYGRGTFDMKGGVVASTMALIKLRASGFKPDRDIILFFNGDEETMQNGALFGTTEWRSQLDAEFALNADVGYGAFDRDGRLLGFALTAAEKVYQTYFFTVRNAGGHSRHPRRDNAIYELADALKKLQGYSFAPQLNPTTRAYFSERQKQERGALGDAMRRWLANEKDSQAADVIEASELEVGMTRTTCVATMLQAGHADNALPQTATATVNCRIMPGTGPKTVQAELQQLVGLKVEIKPDPSFIGKPTPVLPLRGDVTNAYTHAVRALHGPNAPIIPKMEAGTSDSSFFHAVGVPAFGVDGSWGIVPDDESRLHGLDERIPVRALYDDVLHWEMMIKELGGK